MARAYGAAVHTRYPRGPVAILLSDVRRALRDHQPGRLPEPERLRDRASVAMMLAGPETSLSVCVIRRADRPGDHWSGHLAFPGGRADEADVDAVAVAVRETREEVGFDLHRAEQLGALSELPILPTGGVLTPLVYDVGRNTPDLHRNHEVDAVYWVPLQHLWDPTQATTIRWPYGDQHLVFPGIRWHEGVIWGLTLRILASFGKVLGHPLPTP
jgi:8-oxo-dGTP pyrophosphatase MutT (NUDIX family)